MTHTAAISLSSFTTFGELLRYLRRRARLQQRDLAIAVGYSEGQICRLEQNQRLPDLPTLAARFIPALGLEEQPELAACLMQLAASARQANPMLRHDAPVKVGERSRRSVAPTLANPAPRLGNLPSPLTPLINRTQEIAAIGACLTRDDVHLLTLVGPPGIGKTRLGLYVAGEARALFRDGVFFVALAPVRDAALVLPTIAHMLGIKPAGDQPTLEALRAALSERQILLVLDNFEQVALAAPQIAELLRAAPKLKGLVTSRSALHLSGEHLFVVPPLDRPDPRALPPLEQMAAMPAVELFTSRLRAIRPDFVLTHENAGAIAEICARLDGLPLALELAAARGRLFSSQALLDRLRGASGPTALQFLVDGPRDLLVHQQTLRGTIDWSYDLLDEYERVLLMRLAVFVGGCTEAAAEAVLRTEGRRQSAEAATSALSPQTSVLDGLASLVDKSLLKCESGPDETPRFTMLETIREYAREKLDASGQVVLARRQHAAYYLQLVEAAECELSGARQERWFALLDAEYNNLWAALEWFAGHDIGSGLRLACGLRHFWHARGYLSEGRSWIESLLARCDNRGLAEAARARALCVAGFLALHQGDLPRTVALSEASLVLSRGLGERRGIADAMHNLAGVAFMRNQYVRAAELFQECLTLYRALGDQSEVAQMLKNLGLIAKDQGDFACATEFYQESLAIRRAQGDKRGIAQACFNLGVVAYWQGDYAGAIELSEQGLALYRQLGDKMGAAYTLDTLGMAYCRQAAYEQAMRVLDESLLMFRDLGDQFGIALLLTDLGGVALARDDAEHSERLYFEALALAWRIGDKRRAAFCLEGLAAAAGPRQPGRAAML
ncbi:MAG TPA: tetratricopeptide repeat protein, partial [Roseiflexaceae bacterium]|nr:tetratricopeptide repeat protein [Roseiflexaceae bacterium]